MNRKRKPAEQGGRDTQVPEGEKEYVPEKKVRDEALEFGYGLRASKPEVLDEWQAKEHPAMHNKYDWASFRPETRGTYNEFGPEMTKQLIARGWYQNEEGDWLYKGNQ